MTTESHPLASDPLAFLAFEKFRRVGVDRADGQTVTHLGIEHGMTVHTIGTIKTVHIVLDALKGPSVGHQRALAIVEIREHGYAGGPGGLDLMLPALCSGISVHGHLHLNHDYRVLPCLPIPAAFQSRAHDR